MRANKIIAFFCILASLNVAMAQPADKNKQVVDYVNMYKDMAVFEMLRTRIPASITLAQGLLESNNGTSRLAREGHNHFGIKCKASWTGKVILEDDDDFQECFRWYEDAYQSYQDHSNFLLSSSRYAFLFDYDVTDYKSWAYGLKQAGYATNPTYAPQLINLIEKFNLSQYDKYVLTPDGIKDTTQKHEIVDFNGIPSTKARQYDSYTRIAIENKMKVAELLKLNDLTQIRELHVGETVYIKEKANENKKFQTHVIRSGESMHDVSQQYGIKLELLLQRNGLKPGEEPSKGETITLNKKNKKKVKKRKVEKEAHRTVDMRVSVGERTRADSIKEAHYNSRATIENKIDSSLSGINKTATGLEKPYLGNTEIDSIDSDEKPDEVMASELFHYVHKGETVYAIAKMFKITVGELKNWNNLKDNSLKIGQKLQVTNHTGIFKNKEKVFVMETNGFYIIQEGDSLKGLAQQFSLTPEELAAMNKIDTADTLIVGNKLIVVKPETNYANLPSYHVVRTGDTLLSISRKYNISVADLKRLNSLKSDEIKVGKKLFLQ